MILPLQLSYPVETLDHRVLLPAGTNLTQETMDELVRKSRTETFPRPRLMEYGTIAQDLVSICEHPPYNRIFSNPLRTQAVFKTLNRAETVQPLLDIYDHLKLFAPYTYRHILTVYALSMLLGQEMFSEGNDQATLLLAAANHDFGKICVPMKICKKTTPLTEQERHYLSHHTAAGYVLLSYYYQDAYHPAAIVARDHHERRNASGYPRGVNQESLFVEIVTIGDLFDALISPRPYRPVSYDVRSALDEITQLAINGSIRSDVVCAMINCNRGGLASYKECTLSYVRRGSQPAGNLYRGAAFSRLPGVVYEDEVGIELLDDLTLKERSD